MYLEPEAVPAPGYTHDDTTVRRDISKSEPQEKPEKGTKKKFPWWIIIVGGAYYVLQG